MESAQHRCLAARSAALGTNAPQSESYELELICCRNQRNGDGPDLMATEKQLLIIDHDQALSLSLLQGSFHCSGGFGVPLQLKVS